MKRTFFTILLFASATIIYAQPTPKYPKVIVIPIDTTPVKGIYKSVEQEPEFPGGFKGFNEFLVKNLKYPKTGGNVIGKVFIYFIVEKNGSLSNLEIARSLGPEFDNEALRLMKLSPKWKAGIQKGKRVRVRYSVPISFSPSQ